MCTLRTRYLQLELPLGQHRHETHMLLMQNETSVKPRLLPMVRIQFLLALLRSFALLAGEHVCLPGSRGFGE